MAKKESTAIKKAQAATAAAAAASTSSTSTGSSPSDSILPQTKTVTTTFAELQSAINTTINDYLRHLTPKLKLIDIFLVFLVALGILQFIYVLLIGNFPFNAFLGGFAICVGQFVLLVSLRLQINDHNASTAAANGDDGEEEVVVAKSSKSKSSKKKSEKETIADIDEIDVTVGGDDDELEAVSGDDDGKSKKVFTGISPERSFADFIFASLILHFIVIHFIN
ncbi:OST2 [Candida metapsilosis]|uniref:Dolichyl-diphosphooligosaccharide--protein glycosyltransferase subunit OST2 n=1 Tax=Candida metapsilosis TaxID=273372 RepID=A0A8H8DCR9_9ASCO|nr:OST2 [Candida metapsilosis]